MREASTPIRTMLTALALPRFQRQSHGVQSHDVGARP